MDADHGRLQGLQVSQRLDAASRRPCRSEVSQFGRRLRGPRKWRVRCMDRRGCDKSMQCGCSGLPNKRCRSDDSLHVELVSCGESTRSGLSATRYGLVRGDAMRDARCCSVCRVTLAAVARRPSASRDMWPRRQNTNVQYRSSAHKATSYCGYTNIATMSAYSCAEADRRQSAAQDGRVRVMCWRVGLVALGMR